jgi:FlaA1/EpsC-like NDP-sugar epimerase
VQPESDLPLSAFLLAQVGLTIVTLGVFYFKGLYAQPRGASWIDQMSKIAGGGLTSVAVIVLASLLVSPVLASRLVYLFFYAALLMVFGAERYAIRRVRMMLWHQYPPRARGRGELRRATDHERPDGAAGPGLHAGRLRGG